MKQTNNFSWSRFWSYTQAVATAEKRTMLMRATAFVGVCVLIYLFFYSISSGGEYKDQWPLMASRFTAVMAGLVLAGRNVSASFRRFFSRGTGTAVMMLPAARSEKFLHTLLANVILVPMLITVMILLNDAAWSSLFDIKSMWSEIIDMQFPMIAIGPDGSVGFTYIEVIKVWIFTLTGVLSSLAYFFFFGVFFRRHQFFYALLVSVIVAIPFLSWSIHSGDSINLTRWIFADGNTSLGFLISVTYNLLWIVGMLYWAWRRFFTLQINK